MIRMILIYTGLFVAAAGALWLRPDGATQTAELPAEVTKTAQEAVYMASYRPTQRPDRRAPAGLPTVDSAVLDGLVTTEQGTGIASLVLQRLEEDASSGALAGVVATDDGAVDLAPLLEIPGSIRGADGTRILASALMQRQGNTPSLAGEVSEITTLSASPVPVETVRYYTVQPGDSLGSIAEQVYGSTSAFREIFDANRDVLTSIGSIQVGQKLRLP